MFLDKIFQEVPTYIFFCVHISFAIRNRNLLITKSSLTAAASISLALHACVVNEQPFTLMGKGGCFIFVLYCCGMREYSQLK